MQEPAQRFILNMDTNNELPKAPAPATADEKVDKIYKIIHDARMWLAQDAIDNVKDMLAMAETIVLDLRHGPALDGRNPDYGYHDVDEWVEVVLGNGMSPIKECCITAVKHSQGGRVHYDLVYVTHRDDDGKANYQKLYHVPAGLINSLRKGE